VRKAVLPILRWVRELLEFQGLTTAIFLCSAGRGGVCRTLGFPPADPNGRSRMFSVDRMSKLLSASSGGWENGPYRCASVYARDEREDFARPSRRRDQWPLYRLAQTAF
jgi:hypothetical protein